MSAWMVSGRTSDLFSSMKSKMYCPSQAPEVVGGTGADHGRAKHKRRNSYAPAVLLPTGSWEKASTGVASSTFAPNLNLQTSGVTNEVSSQEDFGPEKMITGCQ